MGDLPVMTGQSIAPAVAVARCVPGRRPRPRLAKRRRADYQLQQETDR
jgi:hypothetical protein